jgi:hypothetical protein
MEYQLIQRSAREFDLFEKHKGQYSAMDNSWIDAFQVFLFTGALADCHAYIMLKKDENVSIAMKKEVQP